MVHEIQVAQYKTVPSSIKLGTFDSYGTEQLHFTFGSGWEDLAVYATFTAPTDKSVQTAVDLDGYIDVPPEATAGEAGQGEIVLVGKAEGVNRITVTLHYTVLEHGPVQGAEPAVPTPDLLQQVLTLSKDAQQSAKNAEQSAKNAVKDATDTVKPYKEEAAQAAAAAALSEKSAAESKVAAQKAAEVAAQAGIAAVNAADAAEKAAGTATGAAGSSALNAENAQKSAQNAQQSATDAAESQQAANASADAAAKSQQSAAIHAKNATDAKVAAAGSADDAADSAAAAENSASAAAGSEQAAGTSEERAAKSEGAAKESEQAAAKSAQAAAESKTAAAESEKNAAESAKKAKDIADSLPEDYTTAVSEISKLKTDKADKSELDTVKQQVENITPDDSSVGEKPWSSKNIVDMLCPPLEESGNPVVCYPVAGYPLGVKAKWEPVQEGSGTPHPAGGGKNKCPFPSNSVAYPQRRNGLTVEAKDGTYIVNGTATANSYFSICDLTIGGFEDFGNFVLSGCPAGSSTSSTYFLAMYTGEKWYADTGAGIAGQLNKLGSSARIEITIKTGYTASNLTFRPQLEKGSTPTAYAPYENIRPIKGRGSVTVERCGENLIDSSRVAYVGAAYGLTAQYVSEKITISGIYSNPSISTVASFSFMSLSYGLPLTTNFKCLSLKLSGCTSAGIRFTDNTRTRIAIDISGCTNGEKIEVSFYPIAYVGSTAPTTYTPYIGQTNTLTLPETVYGGEVDAVSGEGIKNWERIVFDGTESWNVRTVNYTSYSLALPRRAQTGLCTHFKKILYDAIRPDAGTGETGCYLEFSSSAIFNVTFENVTDWKNYLAAQYAAGTPVCIVFQYANKANEPFTATGAQPIHALSGTNTVLTDADSATVTGRADPIKRITDLEDAVASQA